MTVQNLWDIAKAVSRGKYIAIRVHLKEQERSHIHTLTLYLKELEKQIKLNASRRREIIKTKAEINNTETNKQKKPSKTDQGN